ncbi:HPr family phosphocarrier protein [Hirschia baltica]|uniref:Phosphotransferase system, phosphocarrier protein HPr n=1 Tax=Hirschia baltica (strain ATCC 49814 / DSM 5838 / IFAM 1418) TaxID=582402 RepID=C6XL63_HIRBI|nr:HPr family phosphocarrier protein [Hirschia baltica]ACT57892.1 Phosphotransferase system, phosphocarrier protein HPr [Hirschia baltica ATCC 49814]
MTETLTKSATICNTRGLHARASAALAREALKFDSKIIVSHEGEKASAIAVMDLLMLTAYKGCVVEVSAEGKDADQAIVAIVDLIENRFGEDD